MRLLIFASVESVYMTSYWTSVATLVLLAGCSPWSRWWCLGCKEWTLQAN